MFITNAFTINFFIKMSTPETEGTNFVDLTLTERFGYTRKTPVKHQKESCRVKSEVEDSATKRVPGRSYWGEIDWHKSRKEEQQEASLDVKNYGTSSYPINYLITFFRM